VKMFDAGKTRMIGLPYGENKLWRYANPFSSDIGTWRTDRRTDLLYQYRASVYADARQKLEFTRINSIG